MVIAMSSPLPAPASDWVRRYSALIPASSKASVLDLACGHGRHARFLQQAGFKVCALDLNPAAFAELEALGIATLQHDLEQAPASLPFQNNSLAAIIVSNYLHRPLFGELQRCLMPGGILIYETFMQGQQALGKPSRPEFLLNPDELLGFASAPGWHILGFEQGGFASADSSQRGQASMRQRLCAQKPIVTV